MNKSKTHTITIDPKMFIGKPYTKCPECNKNDSFGLLMVNRNSYTKRCKKCWHTQNYKLPKLNKKIIYLDQFVISNMMLAINDKLGKKDKVNKVYLKLFEKLDKLVKAQLILCPDSEFHQQESQLSFYKELKRMYEHLSHSTSFYDSSTIRRFQISNNFRNSINGSKDQITIDDILHGDRNEWQSKIRVSVDFRISEEDIKKYREERNTIHKQFESIFEAWKKQKNPSFESFFNHFSLEFGNTIVNKYSDFITRYFQASMGVREMSQNEMFSFMGEPSVLITSLLRYLKDDKDHANKLKEIFSYLQSDELRSIPFNEIYNSLWAAIAYQVSTGGRKTIPNIGMFVDTEMLSVLFPYSDAIFVDKDMYSILNFGAVKEKLSKYKVKTFSLNNIDDFFEYLDETEKRASKAHYTRIKKVYGKGWLTPYFEMYDGQ